MNIVISEQILLHAAQMSSQMIKYIMNKKNHFCTLLN